MIFGLENPNLKVGESLYPSLSFLAGFHAVLVTNGAFRAVKNRLLFAFFCLYCHVKDRIYIPQLQCSNAHFLTL